MVPLGSRARLLFFQDGVLCRRWLPSLFPQEDAPWASVTQLVVPTSHRQGLLKLAHDGRFSGHLGVRKTFNKLARKFYWPGMKSDVSRHCKTCKFCQQVGKPNQKIPLAPLVKIPQVREPFVTVV